MRRHAGRDDHQGGILRPGSHRSGATLARKAAEPDDGAGSPGPPFRTAFHRNRRMFAACADPKSIEGLTWVFCYLTSGKHCRLLLVLRDRPAASGHHRARCPWHGFHGRHRRPVAHRAGQLAGQDLHLDGARRARHHLLPVLRDRAGSGARIREEPFRLRRRTPGPGRGWSSASARRPRSRSRKSSAFWHQAYGFGLAVVTFAIVFGAFVANVIYGAMQAVPRAQLETAEAYGMSPRARSSAASWCRRCGSMRCRALGNLWMILIKATPLLFLLGVKDIVYYARELGRVQDPGLRIPAWRLAAVVLPGAAGLLPDLHPHFRDRHLHGSPAG